VDFVASDVIAVIVVRFAMVASDRSEIGDWFLDCHRFSDYEEKSKGLV